MNVYFQENGNLVPGIHLMTIEELEEKFAFNNWRKKLFEGLKLAISHLLACNCKTVFIDGSFVTTKETPGDFDACWDATDVNIPLLLSDYGTLADFDNDRKNQKLKYLGELFVAQAEASPYDIFIDFFQKDRDGAPKGIVRINLI